MAKEVIEQELRMKATEVVNSMQELEKVTKGYATQLHDVLDYLDKIEKKAPAVSNIVNNTKNINNANTYNQNITNKTNKFGRSKFKDEVVIGDTIYSYNAGSNTKSAKAAQQAAIEALQKENQLILEKINLEKELTKVQTARERLLTKRASTWDRDSGTASKNADANLLREKTRAAHPELFAAGALNRNWRYQSSRMLGAIGNRVSPLGAGGRIIGDTLNVAAGFLKAPAAGVTAIFSTLANSFVDLSKAATKAYTEIEAIKTQLGVVFSSQTQANSTFSEIAQYAVRSPFGVQQTSELAVLLKQSGVYASDLMDTLRMLGDTAGGNMEKMKRIANNYAQIVSIGKASMLDMRQFAYAGIPIFEAVSKELGVSQQELRKLISDGKVTSDIIEKVFKDLTGINGIFKNATEIGAKTLKARLQNLQDAKQLALSSIGENLVNIGEVTGGDSYVKNIVAWTEKIYQWMYTNINTKNIEKSVKVIETRESKIDNLRRLRESSSDPAVIALLDKAIKLEENKIDYEKERATYSALYEAKVSEVLDAYQRYGTTENARNLLNKYNEVNSLGPFDFYSFSQEKQNELLPYLQIDRSVLTEEIQLIKQYLDYRKEGLQFTKKEIDAEREALLIKAQARATDEENKSADSRDSLNTSFQELAEIYKNSEEYKKKQEEEHNKLLNEALGELKKLSKHADDNGTFRFTDLSMKDFLEYRKKGVFNATSLPVVWDGKNVNTDDYNLLRSQFSYAASSISGLLGLSGDTKASSNIARLLKEQNNNNDVESYLRNFSKTYDEIEKIISGSGSIDDVLRKSITTWLLSSTQRQSINDTAKDLNTVETKNEKTKEEPEFIALWRRALGQSLGISPLAVTGTKSALDFYQNDTAVRNMASRIFSTAIGEGSMSIERMQRMLSPTTGTKMMKGDDTLVWQTDWESVKKNLKEFANSLNASTSVINSYKDSVQDEYTTLLNLLTNGIHSQETNTGTTQKYVTASKIEQSWLSTSELGVNAFGEILQNTDGQIVSKIQDGIAYTKDADGKEIKMENQNLLITGNIYEELKRRLPELDRELKQITTKGIIAEGRDAIVDSRWFTYAMPRINTTAEGREYIDSNQAYYKKLLQAEIESARTNLDSSLTVQQILDLWLQGIQSGQSVSEEADNIMNLAISRTSSNNPFVGGLRQLSERQRYNKYRQTFANIIGGETRLDQNDWFAAFENKNLYGEALRLAGFDENVDFGKLAKDNGVDEITARQILAQEAIRSLKNETLSSLAEITKNGITDGFIAPFETLGESIIKLADGSWEAADAWDELSNKMRGITGSIISQTGDLMKNAGLALIQAGAMEHNKAYIWGGIGLAAAGGIAAGLGNALSNSQKDTNKSQDEQKKLESLTDRIEELLRQARADALYYEKNLRHRTALGINEKFSYTSVNDAVITPKGDVIQTSPDDYLFAMKHPQSMGAVQPKINFTVIDNAGVRVETRQNTLPDGTVELQAILQSAMDEYIASERSDNAFAMRNYRINGRQSVM